MVMRAMRDSAKWVMLILALAFVGWLVFDWVQARGVGGGLAGGPDPVVGKVEGRDIRNSQWNLYLENQMAAARSSRPGGLTEDELRQVREGAWENLVSEIVLQSEIERLGIRVTDEEVRAAFLSRPPPEFQNEAGFQTDGRFDITKYRNFVTSPAAPETMLLQLENYYRQVLPREKLANQVVDGIYVSEEDAWEYYRDINETVQASFVSFDPELLVADSLVTIATPEIESYYRENRDEFKRPATATVHLLNIPVQPTSSDTAASGARADSLFRLIDAGDAEFEEIARTASADSLTGANGGDLGMRGRGQLDPRLEEVAFSASIGSVSAPVETGFGFHLVRVDSRSGDSVSVSHILIPVEVSDATEDSIFDLLDDLEDRAIDDGLIAAAAEFGMTVSPNIVLTVGSDFVPGIGALGVAPEWAQDPQTQMGDVTVFESFAGQHVFELVSRGDAGFFSVEEVESDIRQRLARERKKTLARDRVVQVADAIGAGSSLQDAAADYGGRFFEAQTFRRLDFVPGLGQGSEAIGEAFGIGVGETSGVAEAGEFWAIVSVEDRTVATREEFEEQKELLRQQLTLQRRQAYMNRWMVALREKADVQDFRAQLAELAAAQQS